jgi:hypothetical protein
MEGCRVIEDKGWREAEGAYAKRCDAPKPRGSVNWRTRTRNVSSGAAAKGISSVVKDALRLLPLWCQTDCENWRDWVERLLRKLIAVKKQEEYDKQKKYRMV